MQCRREHFISDRCSIMGGAGTCGHIVNVVQCTYVIAVYKSQGSRIKSQEYHTNH